MPRPGLLVALAMLLGLAATAGCTTMDADAGSPPAVARPVDTLRVKLASGAADVDVDVYWPDRVAPAPLVIVAHGFMRQRRHMSGWGKHLARAGFVVAIPDLPASSNHVRNGRFIDELRVHLSREEPGRRRVDPARVGYLGFSAGGLASLLAAADADASAVTIWIGLDPVDRDGLGAKAAPRVSARTLVLSAEPSACNAQGNARDLIAALPDPEHHRVSGAVHVDAEWPTSALAEAMCGRSRDAQRDEFRRRATEALRAALCTPDCDRAPESQSVRSAAIGSRSAA